MSLTLASTAVSAHTSVDAVLEVIDLSHAYPGSDGPVEVLDRINCAVRPGEFVCIVGPSGVGKSTLLRCLAGLQRPTGGQIRALGKELREPSESVGLVFQDYSRSLLPWLSVLANVALPLRHRFSRAARNSLARRALQSVGLEQAGSKYPWQLSGGMQQRVAIARALAYEPKVLLMDEPFASVDAQTREDLEDLVLQVRNSTGQAIVLITHDIDEAIYLADRVVVLGGRPAEVRADLVVPLGKQRDQLVTKATPEFAELRSRVHHLIRDGAIDPARDTDRGSNTSTTSGGSESR